LEIIMSGEEEGGRQQGAAVPVTREAAGLDEQRAYWNSWNADKQRRQAGRISKRQREVVVEWLEALAPSATPRRILEVGCGAGWFIPDLRRYGVVTAIDFAEQAIALARQTSPDADFRIGDFMSMNFENERFDVIVCLEVLAHVADHGAFASKLRALLTDEGQLMLSTQNRPVLERWNTVAPPQGQLRHWFDEYELRKLFAASFEIADVFTVSPIANRGIRRFLNSEYLNAPLRLLIGNSFDRLKERWGWGWTLMLRARPWQR
jgi:2-polyprenyl-3-methyl-5-hydroxy-6-metoxy-1,4-benzoquinol methylase